MLYQQAVELEFSVAFLKATKSTNNDVKSAEMAVNFNSYLELSIQFKSQFHFRSCAFDNGLILS